VIQQAVIGPSVPRRGNALLRALGRAVLGVMGWRIVGEIADRPKMVIAVAPHTSNWDFVIGASAMFAMDLDASFLGKHTLFRGPFGPPMRWIGGIAVNRSSPHGVVGDAIAAFASSKARVLAIAPQGTRSPVAHFRSGFLNIARGARVPIVLAALDYEARRIRMGPMLELAEDAEAQLAEIEGHFSAVRGRNR
jgi:1-acyl-sn-glycerol-3-phosphate acyltransferase